MLSDFEIRFGEPHRLVQPGGILYESSTGGIDFATFPLHFKTDDSNADSSGGFVSSWLDSVTAGEEMPVALQLCKLQTAARSRSACNITGQWTYAPHAYVYNISERSDGTFSFSSNFSGDPWHHASGR